MAPAGTSSRPTRKVASVRETKDSLVVRRLEKTFTSSSLGATPVVFSVRGVTTEGALVKVPLRAHDLDGVEPRSARVFRVRGEAFEPIWHSGVNLEMAFAWARIDQDGTFVVIGLPADLLLSEAVREAAVN